MIEVLPKSDQDNNLSEKDNIDFAVAEQEIIKVEHISFDMLKELGNVEKQVQPVETAEEPEHIPCMEAQTLIDTPVQQYPADKVVFYPRIQGLEKGQFLDCNCSNNSWTGVGVNLIPP